MARNTLAGTANFATQSESFDNAAWTKSLCSVTADQIANPVNGALTADLVTENNTSGVHMVSQTMTLGRKPFITYTASAYFKNNTRRYAGINLDTGGSNTVIVDLTNGTVTSNLRDTPRVLTSTPTVEALPNGWYRISLAVTPFVFLASVTLSGITFLSSNNGTSLSYAGDGTSSYYLFGAQCVIASWAGWYTPTTAAAISNPIRNLSTGRSQLASTANMLFYSEQFDNAAWVKFNTTTITPNTVPNPIDGAMTASSFNDGSAISQYAVYQLIEKIAGKTYTMCAYGKNVNPTIPMMVLSTNGGGGGAYFNLVLGVIDSTTPGSTSQMTSLGGGWYRCSVTTPTPDPDVNFPSAVIFATIDSSSTVYQGTNGTVMYIYGAQLTPTNFEVIYLATTSTAVFPIREGAVSRNVIT